MSPAKSVENGNRKCAWILAAIALIEGAFVLEWWITNPQTFPRYLGFGVDTATSPSGWLLASTITVLYVLFGARLPAVREHLLRPTLLKMLGLAVALAAGILEEVVFRRMLMDSLQSHGVGTTLQIVASGVAFGSMHGIWGVMGKSARAAGMATLATGVLGSALALVFVVAGRNLVPCIAAHFFINAFLEPGLVLAAVRGEMGHPIRSGTVASR